MLEIDLSLRVIQKAKSNISQNQKTHLFFPSFACGLRMSNLWNYMHRGRLVLHCIGRRAVRD